MSPQGNLLQVNRATCQSLGYSEDELLKLKLDDITHPDDRQEYWSLYKQVRSGRRKAICYEKRDLRKDGETAWMFATLAPVHDSQDNLLYLVALAQDITEHKKQAEKNRQLEAQLQQAQKMEAIGTCAGGIAHDFNNILALILGYATLAKQASASPPKCETHIEKILAASNRAKALITQILTYCRQTTVERVPIQLEPLFKEILKMLRSSLPTTIKMHNELDPNCRFVLADPTQAHQILMNLCTNAGHAMEETGGILKTTLRNVTLEKASSEFVLNLEPGEYVELIVSDTGCGISSDILDRIFEPYFTTKGPGKGTGMGLSIIHGIVTSYGGAITVESEPAQGTTFHVFFPAIEQKELPCAEVTEVVPLGNERILFIDDEILLTEITQELLEPLGYRVTTRQSSLEALETFRKHPENFDLIITDQTMPDMTGTELATQMLQLRPDIPIILCTGYSSMLNEKKAKALGIREFVLKPVGQDTIARLIRKVLDGSSAMTPILREEEYQLCS